MPSMKMFVFSLQAQTELGFENRLSLEGSLVILDDVNDKDEGLFTIKDLQNFTVSTVFLEMKRKQGVGKTLIDWVVLLFMLVKGHSI